MNGVAKPNFFIVGAPKSGTTSLYFYLRQHPQIYLPRIKELNFFCTDLHFKYPLLNGSQFTAYYADCRNQKAIGEVSVWNLFSAVAAKNIYRFNPESRIIILLRNPVEMMYALHGNHVFNNNELIADFEEALNAQDDRKRGLRISSTIKSPVEALFYFDIASYSEQVSRYFNVFGKENVHVTLFDDFIANTPEVYRDILRFLKVDQYLPAEFKIFNSSKETRSNMLKQLTIDAPAWAKRTGRWLFPHQSRQRDWLMYWLWKINTKKTVREKMDRQLEKKLKTYFRKEILNLQSLLARDLSHWL